MNKIKKLYDKFICLLLRPIVRNQEKIIKAQHSLIKQNEYNLYFANRINNESFIDFKKRYFKSLNNADNEYVELRQKGNFALLRIFKQICDKYNIDYWLDGGTLLGVSRHGNFIPWDDDIDVAMEYNDYLKLEKIIKNDNIVKLIDNSSSNKVFNIKDLVFKDSNHIWYFLDIFIYSKFSGNKENVIKKYNLYRSKLKRKVKTARRLNKIKSCFSKKSNVFSDKLNCIFDKSKKQFVNSLNVNNKKLTGLCKMPDSVHEVITFNYNDIFPLKEIEFGGVTFKRPNNLEKVLELMYKHFMDFPSDGCPFHCNIEFDKIEITRKFLKDIEKTIESNNRK